MKKYFVSGDVHGFLVEWKAALEEAGFDINNPDHIIINCGDLLDRGKYPYQCLEFVMSLPPERRILIRGNHEDLMEDAIYRRIFLPHDVHNGTRDSAFEIVNVQADLDNKSVVFSEEDICDGMEKNKLYQDYIKSTLDYYESDKHIFVHGWIPCCAKAGMSGPSTYKYTPLPEWKTGDWRNARWACGMKAWHDGVVVPGKTIVCGHWHTSFGHSEYENNGVEWPNPRSTEFKTAFEPFIDDGIIAVDGCVAYSHKVNVIVIKEGDF